MIRTKQTALVLSLSFTKVNDSIKELGSCRSSSSSLVGTNWSHSSVKESCDGMDDKRSHIPNRSSTFPADHQPSHPQQIPNATWPEPQSSFDEFRNSISRPTTLSEWLAKAWATVTYSAERAELPSLSLNVHQPHLMHRNSWRSKVRVGTD
ncbi:hypothetical protein LguiA_011057 [Lonicera macranthoides]